MIETTEFQPTWASPPGDTISDLLEEKGWDQAELSLRTGFSRKHVNELIQGKSPLSPAAAERLSYVLGSTSAFWLSREAHYQASLERRRSIEAHRPDAPWLAELPLSWMIKQGWVQRFREKGEQVRAALTFFGVASVDAWRGKYAQPLAAFRASSAFDKKIGAVAAWLRQAEVEAAEVRCAPYDKRAFRALLPALRALTLESDPAVFIPSLREACAKVGVAVVFVPAPPGCPVHGVTRWLSPERAMLALSLRYRSNDQLWFSFFHEACHVLRHARKQLFVEGFDGLDPELEAEADRFAATLLIPAEYVRELSRLRGAAEVEALASHIGVAPGILVGRMQREGWIEYSHLNGLKTRYAWGDEVPSTT